MGKAAKRKATRQTAPPPVQTGRQPVRVQRSGFWLIAAAAVAAFIVATVVATHRSGSSAHGSGPLPAAVDQASLVGLQTGPPPWKPEIARLAGRLRTLGLPQLSHEGTVLHIHQHLDVFVDGKPVSVPGGIGIDDNTFISPIHTHDASGIIHVESPTSRRFTLGQFFAIWGVRFTRRALGGITGPVQVYVDGKPAAGDLSRAELKVHEEIAVVVGRAPYSVPSHYSFPAGE